MATEADKTLIIAEKPSVAADIVKVLPGKFQKLDAYYEGPAHIVSFAIGHLVAIANPKEMDERHKAWSLDNLPIIPEKFMITALPRTKTQLSALAKLMKRKDVKEIINACDAGREGELIFRYIVQYVSETKPVKAKISRLWLQSMTKNSIEEGFRHLRSDADMQHLAQAAMCRSEADWLVGINGSRALTGYKSQWGGFVLTPCGRVQTPTLSMIVRREWERDAFKPRNFWEAHAEFAPAQGGGGEYPGRWFDPAFKKAEGDDDSRAERMWDEAAARAIVEKCQGKPAQVSDAQKPSSQSPPPLYDLTSLQRDANARFGFSAKNTLGIAQALYERHKALTYPRTDSRYLPNDYLPLVKSLMQSLKQSEYARFAAQALENGYVRMDRRIFDESKVSNHHAIIPTTVLPGDLSEPERKIYQAVVQRFLAVFFPPARFLNTTRISVVEGESFRTDGKVLEEPGWKAIYGMDKKEEAILPSLVGSANVRMEASATSSDYMAKAVELKADATRPPPRLNESTLLSFMESAGKYVDDEELKEALKERGLGTPATRAAIIEGLLADKYIVREGKELIPTAKGSDLLRLLSAIGIEELVSPELTGEWEFKLNRIEKGLNTREAFMREIQDLARAIVSKVKGYDEGKEKKEAAFPGPDGQKMYETLTRYESEDGKVAVRKVLGGRQMSEAEIAELLSKRRIGPFPGFRSKMGKPFTAAIKLDDKDKVSFVFEDNSSGMDGKELDISKETPLGLFAGDGSNVYETLTSYMSESALNNDPKGLRVNKMILGKGIDHANMQRMLAGEKTELIKGFQSSKTRRFFDAYLKLSKEGKISFEFPPREFKGRGRFGKSKVAEAPEGGGEAESVEAQAKE